MSRRVFVDMRGAECAVGPGPVVVAVQTVARAGGTETRSAAAIVRIPGRPARIVYRTRVRGAFGLRRAQLVLTSERSCRLPPIVVVYRDDGVVPLSPDRGIPVAEIEERDLTGGRALVLPLGGQIRSASGWPASPPPVRPRARRSSSSPHPRRWSRGVAADLSVLLPRNHPSDDHVPLLGPARAAKHLPHRA